jgi:curved DNA-binding protein CbpA
LEYILREYKYYKLLEIKKNCSQTEIKQAYRRLAKLYHPDRNPEKKAHEKFKKINEAYEVLSDSESRKEYDNSLEECPECGTHEVIQTIGTYWRCRHCGSKFDPSIISQVVERVQESATPDRLKRKLELFKMTQCSWCRDFYTQPFLCPYGRLQSSCISIRKLSEQERKILLNEEKWWIRIEDMINNVRDNGIMAKCREPDCFALNPNPKQHKCWRCGKNSLSCPNPTCGGILLEYDIIQNVWKCRNTAHGKKYVFVKTQTKRERNNEDISTGTTKKKPEGICPNCGGELFYDKKQSYWRCKRCQHVYFNSHLKKETYTSHKTDKNRIHKSNTASIITMIFWIFLIFLFIGITVYALLSN